MIFSVSKLILYSFYLKKKYNYYDHFENYELQLLKKYINNCGCVCTKCIQWLVPLLEKEKINEDLLNILNEVYENNNTHDISHTEYLYNKHFKVNMINDYEIIDMIGSGSMGQVYKIKCIKSSKYYVMKVKHPNIESQVILFKNIFKFIYNIKIFNKIFYKYFPFNLVNFLEDFYKQSDFINECNNLLEFYHNYKPNDYILIPKLHKISNDIIIMEYIEGTCIDYMDISSYEKYKIINLLHLFMRNNMAIINNNHGDLHKYNWKVSNDKIKNVYKIIIYDFGYCFKYKGSDHISNLCNLTRTYDKDNDEKVMQYKKLLQFIFNKENIDFDIDFNHKIAKPRVFMKQILDIALKNNIMVNNHTILNILLLLCLVDDYFTKYNIGTDSRHRVKYNILNAYTFCEYHNIFNDLSKLLMKEYKILNKSNKIFECIVFNEKIKALIKN